MAENHRDDKYDCSDLSECLQRQTDSQLPEALVCSVCKFACSTHAELGQHAKMHAKDDVKLSPNSHDDYHDDRNNNEHKMMYEIASSQGALVVDENIYAMQTDDSRSPWVSTPKRIYTCPDCHVTTRNAKCHLHHLASAHGRTFDIFECDMCDYATRYKQKLTRHRRCHFGKTSDDAVTNGALVDNNNGFSGAHDKDESMREETLMSKAGTQVARDSMCTSPSTMSQTTHNVSVQNDRNDTKRNINSCAVWQVAPNVDEYTDERFNAESELSGKKSPTSASSRLTLKLSKLGSAKSDTESEPVKPNCEVQPNQLSSVYLQAALTKPHTSTSPNDLKTEPKLDAGDRLKTKTEMESLLELEQASHQYPSEVVLTKRKVYSAVREAVDPAKYVIIHEIDGTKFACSRCGNIYKWRKSLNKHWKEKHDGETPPAMPVGALTVGRGRGGRKSGAALREVFMGGSGAGGGGGLKYEHGSQVANKMNSSRDVKSAQNSQTLDLRRTEERRRKNGDCNIWPSVHPMAILDPYLSTRSDILPPNAHSHHHYSQHTLVPDIAVDLSIQSTLHSYPNDDDDDDEDDSALDLSRSTIVKKAAAPEVPPPQEKPLDFSVKYSPAVTPTNYQWGHFCSSCEQSFQTATDLAHHYEQCHLGERQGTNRRYACHICNVAFACKRSLADHFLQTHAQLTNPYADKQHESLQCIQCEFIATSSSELARHSLKHSLNSRALTCRLCVFRAHNAQELSNHYVEQHSPKTAETPPATQPNRVVDLTADGTVIVIPQAPEDTLVSSPPTGSTGSTSRRGFSSAELLLPYKCSVCEYRARWPSEISQHMKNHSDEKPYHCPRCVYRSKWKWDVVKHLKRCGGGTVDDVIDTSKRQGESPATTPPKRNNAKRQVLSRGPPNVTVHGDQNTDAKQAVQLFCDKCAFIGNSAAELRRHVRVHCEDKPFICRTCGYCSKWKCDLKKHLRAYDHVPATPLTYGGHGRKPAQQSAPLYKCDSCDYTTHRLVHYEKHRRQHDSQLTCKMCSYKATDLSSFLQHKRTHVDTETPPGGSGGKYRCDQCGWTAQRSGQLLQHMHTVHAVKSGPGQVSVWAGPSGTAYGCERCAFTSRSRNAAQIHANWHGSRLAFTCRYCDYSRNSRHRVNAHMKLFHYNSRLRMKHAIATAPKVAYFVQRSSAGVRYRCTRCAWVTAHRRRMLRHTHARKHACPTCMHVSVSSDLLARHAARMHGARAPSTHQCSQCSFVGNSAAIAIHNRCHRVKSQYVCDLCDYSVDRLSKLSNHRSVHNSKQDCFKPTGNQLILSTQEMKEKQLAEISS